MIGTQLSHFRITAKLGEGGMGEVYRAEDTKLGREVAVKVLPPAFVADAERLARFEREARVLASLNHPNIAGLYEVGDAPIEEAAAEGARRHFLVMELAAGETLAERIARGPFAITEALPIAVQIAEALEAAHERGIVHRDLKPGNVMVDPNGLVKVLDFGLAKAWEPPGGESSPVRTASPTLSAQMTGAGVLLGTASYMSPEQARGQAADRRADVWAFGVVLYEMLLGGRLFAGDTVSDTLAAVLRADPEWEHLPKDLPRPVLRMLRRALTRDPRRRLRDIGDARLDLEAALRGEESETAAAAASTSGRVWPMRVALGALLLATLALGARMVLDRMAPRRVVRATLLPPPETEFHLAGSSPGSVAISPDGRSLAFVAISPDGTRRLWVRPVDALVARELPGTNNAQYPFWSPDGAYVGFADHSALKKIARVGGPSVTLCKTQQMKGASWSREGLVAFPQGLNRPISVVSAAGGEPREVTTFEEGDNSHRHPRFLPDGRHFLFLARRTGGTNQLRIGSIDGGPAVHVIETPTNAEYAAGRLLFVRDATLMAQRFDPAKRQLEGEAVPIVEAVLRVPAAALAVFSASQEGTLVYQTGAALASSRLVWRDRDGQELGTLGVPADQSWPRISPDDSRVALTILDPDIGTGDIWIYDVAQDLGSRLTFDPGFERNAVWSPDGESIAFASESGTKPEIWLASVSGTAQHARIAGMDSTTQLLPDAWSPDGEHLVLGVFGQNGQDLYVLPAAGGEASPLLTTAFSEGSAVLSPDGRWMAYRSDETGRDEIYVTAFPKPGRKWQVSRGEGNMPCWPGDGREIFYRDEGGLYAAAVDGTGDSLVVGAAKRLFDVEPRLSPGRNYDVSSDGQRFLFSEVLGRRDASPIVLVLNWDAELGR